MWDFVRTRLKSYVTFLSKYMYMYDKYNEVVFKH